MSNPSDFIIEDRVLKKYQGPGGDVTIPEGVTEIADNAFNGCESMTSVIIPKGVVRIGDAAFCECSRLTEMTLPEGVKKIGWEVFSNCKNLKRLTLPNSLTEMHSDSFFFEGGRTDTFDIGLTEFDVHEDHPEFSVIDGILYNKDHTELILCPIGRIGEVQIPDGVMRIGDFAFVSCNRLYKITLPNSVVDIGDGAFQCCHELGVINLPESLVNIGEHAFYFCECLTFSSTEENVERVDGGFIDIIIPQHVTNIGEGAFSGINMDTIMIPESVKEIGKYAFTDIDDPPDRDITIYGVSGSIAEKYADENGLSFEARGSGLVIEDGILTKCRGDQEKVEIPEGITSIGQQAFSGRKNLISVTLPDSVTSIGGWAFENCRNLREIILPSSITSIGDHAFHNCSKLAEITIPESFTDFGEDMFWGCKELFRKKAAKAGTTERFLHDDAARKLDKAMALFTSCVERVEQIIREDGEYGDRPVVSDRAPVLEGKIVPADTDFRMAAEFFEKAFAWMQETGMGEYESEITPEHVKAWLDEHYKELADGKRYWFGGDMGIRYPVALAVAYQIYADPDAEIEIEFAKSKWDYRGDYEYSAQVCLMMYHYGDSVFVGYNE